MAEGTIPLRWSAFAPPHVGAMPVVFGAPGATNLLLSAQGSSRTGEVESADVVIGNGPPTADGAEHVLQVVKFMRLLADWFEENVDACADALAEQQADIGLAAANAEHAAAFPPDR